MAHDPNLGLMTHRLGTTGQDSLIVRHSLNTSWYSVCGYNGKLTNLPTVQTTQYHTLAYLHVRRPYQCYMTCKDYTLENCFITIVSKFLNKRIIIIIIIIII